MSDKRISIVMITHNRGDQIRIPLERLLALPEQPHLIVVDNASSDGTVEAARSMGSRVDVLALDQNLGGAGRNIGLSRAETPYVAFSDDDSWWHPGALSRAADLFDSHPTLGLVAARILVGPGETLDPLSQTMATSPLAGLSAGDEKPIGIPIVGFAACGTVTRREAFLQAGGFELRFGVGGEEQVLALDMLRKGWRLAYVEGIVAYHHPSPVRDVNKRKRHEVRNALWTAWLRRPFLSAWVTTRRILQNSMGDQARLAGVMDAIKAIPWVLSKRNPIPVSVEHQMKLAEEAWPGIFTQ